MTMHAVLGACVTPVGGFCGGPSMFLAQSPRDHRDPSWKNGIGSKIWVIGKCARDNVRLVVARISS